MGLINDQDILGTPHSTLSRYHAKLSLISPLDTISISAGNEAAQQQVIVLIKPTN